MDVFSLQTRCSQEQLVEYARHLYRSIAETKIAQTINSTSRKVRSKDFPMQVPKSK
jgi:hypothetical protein